MTPTPVDTSPTPEELRAEVHKLVGNVVQLARAEHGSVPGVGTAGWWTAPLSARLAALLVLAEAHVLRSPDQIAGDILKEASVAISTGHDWTAASYRPSHAELERRRREAA